MKIKGNLVQRLGLALTVGAIGYGCSEKEDPVRNEKSYSIVEKSELENELDNTEKKDEISIGGIVYRHPLWSSEALEAYEKYNASGFEKDSLYDKLSKANDVVEHLLVVFKYAEDKENYEEIKRVLTEDKIKQIENFDYGNIDLESLKHTERACKDDLDYDLNLPDNPKDYSFSQKIALFYAENLFSFPN